MANVDDEAGSKRGIPYYRKALDNLAQEFAERMNDLNTAAGVPGQGNLFSIGSNSDVATSDNGTPLDPTDDFSLITAANISVSKSWNDGNVSMIATKDPNASSGDNSNLAAFLDLFTKVQEFDPKAVVPELVIMMLLLAQFTVVPLRTCCCISSLRWLRIR